MSTARILIIEDESIIAMDMKHKLHYLGYSVVGVAARGEKAVQLAEETRPDLVLMDITLQGDMDGIQASAHIRARFDIPVVYMTAHADSLTIERMNLTEPYGYLLKPVDERAIGITIEMALHAHKLKRQLRISEERYRLLFDTMLNGFALHEIICDEAGQAVDYRFLEVNAAFERLTGLAASELIGKTVLEVMPATETYWIETYGQVALGGEPVQFENYSGELDKYYHVTAYSPQHGQFAVIFEDVTARKQAGEALRVALTKYQTLFNLFPLGITITDEAGKIVESNVIAETLLGIPLAEHSERQIDGPEWRIVRTDGTPMPPEEYASVRALVEKRVVENVEMGIVKSPTETTWISVTAAPLNLPGYGVVITYGDFTKRKQAEETLRAQRPIP